MVDIQISLTSFTHLQLYYTSIDINTNAIAEYCIYYIYTHCFFGSEKFHGKYAGTGA